MSSSPQFVFFDWDGTISDSLWTIAKHAEIACEQMGVRVNTANIRSIVGAPLGEIFLQLGGSADGVAEFISRYRTSLFAAKCEGLNAFPGAVEAIKTLHTRDDLRLAIVSSKSEKRILEEAKHFGIAECFDRIFGTHDDLKREKAELILQAIREFSTTADRVIMIGDRCFDIDGANQNGVRSIGVSWGYANPGELEASGAGKIVASWPECVQNIQPIHA